MDCAKTLRMTLTLSSGQQLYTGSLSNFSGESRWIITATLNGAGANSSGSLAVQMRVRINDSGQASGMIVAGSSIPAGNTSGDDNNY